MLLVYCCNGVLVVVEMVCVGFGLVVIFVYLLCDGDGLWVLDVDFEGCVSVLWLLICLDCWVLCLVVVLFDELGWYV